MGTTGALRPGFDLRACYWFTGAFKVSLEGFGIFDDVPSFGPISVLLGTRLHGAGLEDARAMETQRRMMSTMEFEGLRTDAPPSVKRYLWSPSRWATSLASLLVASCGHFVFGNNAGDGGVDAGGRDVDAGDGGLDAGDGRVDASALPIDGLVAWYPMDQAITTTGAVVDASGHDHGGTCAAGRCPTFDANGRIGGAYMFDGIDDLFHVPSTQELEDTHGFTITAWIKRADSAPSACVINKSYQAFGDNSWQACIRVDGSLLFYSNDDGTNGDGLNGGTLGTSRWYHLALWWDGSRKATYVDGTRVAVTENVSILFDSADIDIGSDIDDPGAKIESPLHGEIDDVRIYNRALSPDEITALQSQ